MWKREVDGLALTFHLAGINNQNFLMRDDQTGSYWQQISGAAISGPMAGKTLELIPSDELTLGLWRKEQPGGTLLQDSPKHLAKYAKKDWEERMQKSPTVLSYAQPGMEPRTLIVGVREAGAARAYPQKEIHAQKLIQDRLGETPLLIVVGPDGQSLRGFRSRIPGNELQFYRLENAGEALMMDDATGSRWNFQGCATEGKSAGVCLERIDIIKDYWFDWRHYNPGTSVFSIGRP